MPLPGVVLEHGETVNGKIRSRGIPAFTHFQRRYASGGPPMGFTAFGRDLAKGSRSEFDHWEAAPPTPPLAAGSVWGSFYGKLQNLAHTITLAVRNDAAGAGKDFIRPQTIRTEISSRRCLLLRYCSGREQIRLNRDQGDPDCQHCLQSCTDQGTILVPRTTRNFASQSGCAGHAGAVTSFPSTCA